MNVPVAPGRPALPPSPQNGEVSAARRRQMSDSAVMRPHMDNGASALTAPITPGNRMPVVDRNKVNPEIRAAAEGMEAMFLDYMMKSMRQTVEKNDNDLENQGTEIFQNMRDSEISQKAAHAGGIGLADQIIAYMDPQRYNVKREPEHSAAPADQGAEQSARSATKGIGGTHAGQ